jgi:hypothetical protein
MLPASLVGGPGTAHVPEPDPPASFEVRLSRRQGRIAIFVLVGGWDKLNLTVSNTEQTLPALDAILWPGPIWSVANAGA